MKLLSVLSAVFALAISAPTTSSAQNLRVMFIDVEGGQATLFVSPTGQSLLVDTGWNAAMSKGRDADRIVAAAHTAGLSRIDTVLLTHYHMDHAGGVEELVKRIPVGTFLDHGPLYAREEDKQTYAGYQRVLATGKYKHLTLKAGDKLPTPGFDAVAISSNGKVITQPVDGVKPTPNPLCAKLPQYDEDQQENGQSLGFLLRFGGVKILDAGDLTTDRERSLMCPSNLLGKIDIFIVSHHGTDWSGSPVFVHSIAPRVAIMDNGAHKGGSTQVIDAVKASPGLEALYQLHLAPPAGSFNPGGSKQLGPEHNTTPEFIANTGTTDGKRLDLTVHPDGTFEVLNERTGATKHFNKR